MKTITHELSEPLMYADPKSSGNEIEASFITISEPTGKIAHLTGILRTEIGGATRNAVKGMSDIIGSAESTDSKEEDATPEEQGEGAYTMLTMGGADMGRVMVTLKEILRNSADVGGEKAMTSALFDKLPESECVNILKAYVGNFIQA